MKTFLVVFLLIAVETFGQQIKPGSKIIVNNPTFFQVIPRNAQIEILADGFKWIEGPLWLTKENKLLFSDILSNSVFEWTEKNGAKLYLKPSGYTGNKKREGELGSNALLLNRAGELILCQHGDRRMAKMNASVENQKALFATLTDNYNGKKFNSPNDAVFSQNGELYFTDPPYGLESGMEDPAKELEFQGVYKLDKNGKTILLTSEISRPNGIAFSPDGGKLYVANSDPGKAIWMVYTVSEDGSLKGGKVFFDATSMTQTLKGLPDGMKVHPDGWIFATGPGGVLIFSPEGEHLGTIFTGELTSNCAFNNDYSVLYITANHSLLRLKLK